MQTLWPGSCAAQSTCKKAPGDAAARRDGGYRAVPVGPGPGSRHLGSQLVTLAGARAAAQA